MTKINENLQTIEDKGYFKPKTWVLSFLFGIHRLILKDTGIVVFISCVLVTAVFQCFLGNSASEKYKNSASLFFILYIFHLTEGIRFHKIVSKHIFQKLKEEGLSSSPEDFNKIEIFIKERLETYLIGNPFCKFIYKYLSFSKLRIFFFEMSFFTLTFFTIILILCSNWDLTKKKLKDIHSTEIYNKQIELIKLELNKNSFSKDQVLDLLMEI
jgi:hypothetical protein